MMLSKIRLWSLVCFIIFCSFTKASQLSIKWQQLLPELAPFNDPFKALTQKQLDDLGYYVGLKNDIIKLEKIKHPKLLERKTELEALYQTLTQDGVQVEKLLAQRKSVALAREQQATSVNGKVIDKNITISGYIVPTALNDKGITEFFLLPHNPLFSIGHNHQAPQPNQAIKVQFTQGLEVDDFTKKVYILGKLQAKTSNKEVTMPDGHNILIESVYWLTADVAKFSG